ncbi:MAG: hypothetical protein FWC38_01115 [Proteobacteria bacterium]|nr:hypothetical protein [Pseudomonadota bacterium]
MGKRFAIALIGYFFLVLLASVSFNYVLLEGLIEDKRLYVVFGPALTLSTHNAAIFILYTVFLLPWLAFWAAFPKAKWLAIFLFFFFWILMGWNEYEVF